MLTAVSPLLTRLIHISPSCWTIYRSFEIILEMELSPGLDFKSNVLYPGFSTCGPWPTGGPRPCIIEIEYVLQDEPLIQGFSTWIASELTGLAFSNALIVAHVVL